MELLKRMLRGEMFSMSKPRFAIIGAGAGGQSMAAILTQKGYSVKLYDNDLDRIEGLNRLKSISVTGKIEATGFPEVVSAEIASVMEDVDSIMVVTTTDAHKDVAKRIAPYLVEGQTILLNPGHVFGALEFSQILFKECGVKKRLVIGEASDLMYACRLPENGKPFHSGIKKTTEVATLPAKDVGTLLEVLGEAFPNLVPMKNIFETGLEGGGAMLHPIPSFMNINKIDSNESFDYYMEGVTPSIAKLILSADSERLAVCNALGLEVPSLVDSLKKTYNLSFDDLYELIQHNKPYGGVKSPSSVNHRFMVEDVTSGIVPLASIGKQLNVETPILNAFIDIASVISGKDFWLEGRTVDKLDMDGKTLEEIMQMIS